MTDLVWPPSLRQSEVTWKPITNAADFPSPTNGITQTVSRPGDGWGCTVRVENSSGVERAQLRRLASTLRKGINPIYLPDIPALKAGRLGSFPASELFLNADLSSATGWSSANAVLNSTDGTLRVKASAGGAVVQAYQSVAFTAFVPYVVRSVVSISRGFSGVSAGPAVQDSTTTSSNYSATRGYLVSSKVMVTGSSANQIPIGMSATSGFSFGDYFDLAFASFSRCFLADGGGNMFLNSDALGSWTISGGSVGANSAVAPDGTTTADEFDENAATAEHSAAQTMTVSATAGIDCQYAVCLKAAGRSWVALRLFESTGSQAVLAYFNISAGTVGTVTSSANFTNGRAFITALGNSWYRCTILGRKANAATSVLGIVNTTTADSGSLTPTGISANAYYGWRGTFTLSAVPSKLTASTSGATAVISQTGSAIYVKGLPVSTNGLLRVGDPFEIDGQYKICTASLDTDSVGCALLQFAPMLLRAVADNTPIIVQNPMGKFRLVDDREYTTRPGIFSDFEFDFVQESS